MGFLESLLWLTLNVYHEARGEPEIGQLAVAHVTLNRAIEERKSIADVVRAPYQFSWTFQKKSYVPLEMNPLQESLRVALKAMTTPDFTSGSTFYHRVDVDPKWAVGKSFIAKYGSHKFYRHNDPPVSALAF
jgi:N-acetylmuramoyl-L-alanine amidase